MMLGTALVTDHFLVREQFDDSEWEPFMRTRRFVDEEVLPVINDYWERAEFPWPLARRLAELELLDDGLSPLALGLVHMELNRGDGSLGDVLRRPGRAGDEGDRDARLGRAAGPLARPMERLEAIGAFALTEPDHGSDSVALETSARREGDTWVIDGAKRWIGNGTIADVAVVWARSTEDGQVKGFLVETGTPGYDATVITGKAAARAVWQADIRLDGVRVPESSRLPGAHTFKDAGRVLVTTRGTVAWGALGHAMAAYDIALTYAKNRHQFGVRWRASRSSRTGS